ncbi:MAG: DUF3347 domain-containing protein [Bacteroidales bacterium]|nr:DUF3347 domain-containing protein [Bacteroidales bacterium]
MNTKRKILLQMALSFSLATILTSCGGGSKQEGESPRLMPSEHGSMSASQKNTESSDNMHKQHTSLADNFSHKDIVILEQQYNPSEAVKAEMEQVINAYLQVKNSFVKDDEKAVNKAVEVMAEKVSALVPAQMEGKGLEAWQNHKTLYEDKLKEMQHIPGLENKRSYFSHISEIVYCTIKSFGLNQGNLFAVFCPMAFDNKGAYWISDSKEIQNPYFGEKMLTCGEIKEEL